MKTIIRRLQKLERRLPPPVPAPSGPSAAERIAEWLARIGMVRGETESLAETTARALGIKVSELRVYLQRRAAGLPAG
jgi:hypothetical protein